MEISTAQMIEDKARFVRGMENLLIMDDRSMVDSLVYRLELQGENPDIYDEYIDIVWTTGGHKHLLITGLSNIQNMIEVAKAVR